MIKIIKLTSVS